MKKAISFLFLFNSILIFAQQDVKLHGIVVEQNSKYNTGEVKYIANTSIKAVGASPQLSDNNGRFALVFSSSPGKLVRIYAEKYGYEVVNKKELEQAAIIGRKYPLKIVLCKQGKLAENTIKYYNIATETIEEYYKKQITIIEQGGREAQTLITRLREEINLVVIEKSSVIWELQKQKEKALKQAIEISQKFAEVNLDDQDSLYIAAYEAFLEKDFDAIFQILDYERLRTNIFSAKEEIYKGEQFVTEADSLRKIHTIYLKKSAESALLAARSARKEGLFNEAIKNYQLSIDADSTIIDNWWEYAEYLNTTQYSSFLIYDMEQAKAVIYIFKYYKNEEMIEENKREMKDLLEGSIAKLERHKMNITAQRKLTKIRNLLESLK